MRHTAFAGVGMEIYAPGRTGFQALFDGLDLESHATLRAALEEDVWLKVKLFPQLHDKTWMHWEHF